MSDNSTQEGVLEVPFNPKKHLTKLKSSKGEQEYLEVKWRLVWFHEKCEHGKITILHSHVDPDQAITKEMPVWDDSTRKMVKKEKTAKGFAWFHVRVEDGEGRVGEAIGSECALDFEDYPEKAQTKAMGRALAEVGYGTQFDPTLNELPRIVDAPVDPQPPQTDPPKVDPPTGGGTKVKATTPVATEAKTETETEKKKEAAPTPKPVPQTPAPKPAVAPASPAIALSVIELRQQVLDALEGIAGPYEQRAILKYWDEGIAEPTQLTEEQIQKLIEEDSFFQAERFLLKPMSVEHCQQILDAIDLWGGDNTDGQTAWRKKYILPEQYAEIAKKWQRLFGGDAIKALKASEINAEGVLVSKLNRGQADKLLVHLRSGEVVNGKIVPKREKVTLAA